MGNFLKPYLVVGSKGMLGAQLFKLLAESRIESAGVDIGEVDITRLPAVLNAIEAVRPRMIINCAAITDVDGCESDPGRAFDVNAQGPEYIAKACLKFGCSMLHMSTDYVFDGLKGGFYREDDPINPLGIYAKSKAEGEARVRGLLPETHCIVRTQWLYGLHGRNFVEAILNQARPKNILYVVNDQHGSPTYAHDLAAALITLCEMEARGTFHVTNSGQTTWHGFASAITQRAGLGNVEVLPMSTLELNRPAPRPLFSALDNKRYIELTGAPLRPWEEALDEYLGLRSEI
jgi:dTDP-4-dehydrorhamnose reductase